MIAVVTLFAACIAILRGWPDVPVARSLHRWLVLPLARRDAAIRRGHLVLAGMVAAAVGAAIWMGGDMIVVMAMGSPEIAGVLATVEVAAWIDGAIAMIAAAGALRGTSIRLWIGRAFGTRRARRAVRTRRARRVASNDDDPAGWVLVA